MLSFIKRHQIILASTILCLFSLHMASADRKGTGGDALVKGLILTIARPLQSVSLSIQSSLADASENYLFLVGLKAENEKLKKRINALVEENNRLKEQFALNLRLKQLLSYKDALPYKTVAATILGFSSYAGGGDWTRVVTINKGKLDNVRVNMPVLSPHGVVGRVVETRRSSSTVLLLTDPRSNIDVLLQRTRVKGIVEGEGSTLKLKYVKLLEDVEVGDQVITAGLSNVFPKGIPVGEVIRAEKGRDNFFMLIEVKPHADLERLEEVLIVYDDGSVPEAAAEEARR